MNIQAVIVEKSGLSYHRIVNPFEYMPWKEGDKHSLLWIGEGEMAINCDVLLYNKYIATPPEMLKMLQANGTKIVVDVDDMWDLPVWHPEYSNWVKSGKKEYIEENIKLADLVICTSMYLQDKVRGLNKNTVVIPNAFPYGYENYKPMPNEMGKMVFMYMGGVTHLQDVKLLEGKFRRIGSDSWIKDNATFILAGYERSRRIMYRTREDRDAGNNNYITEEVTGGPYDHMKAVFSYTNSYDVYPTASLDEYINYYDMADVALVPLVDNEWNRCKSVLKIAEAGCKEIPVICSKVEPYWPELKNCPGIMWVEKPDDWMTHIKWCIKNPQKVKDMGKELGVYCREHYDLLKWNEVRYNVINSLL